MGRGGKVGLVVGVIGFLGLVSQAAAQVTATGEAFGSRATLLGADVAPLDQADTGLQTSTAPNPGFSVVKPPSSTIPASPLALIYSGASATVGNPNGANPAVSSVAGSVTADVLPMLPPSATLIQVNTDNATASVSCNSAPTATSSVNLLVINGTPVAAPGEMPTTILAPQLPLIVANARSLGCDLATQTCFANVLALDVQAITMGEILDLKFSGASAKLEHLPLSCPVFGLPILDNSTKEAVFLNDANGNGQVDAGDTIKYTVTARNTGASDGTNLVITDRLPTNFTLDTSSVTLDGSPVTANVANCPGTIDFGNACLGEPGVDTARQCLTVQGGTLPHGPTSQPGKKLVFSGTATSSSNVCNAVVFQVDGVKFTTGSTVLGSNAGTPTPGTPTPGTPTPSGTGTPGTATPGTPTPGATETPGANATATETPSGGGGGGGSNGRCGPSQRGVVKVVENAAASIAADSTASGGAIKFNHNCNGSSVRVRSVTLGLSGRPDLLRSMTATGMSRGVTVPVTVSPVGPTATFTFNPPLFLSALETADVRFQESTQTHSAGDTMLLASMFPGRSTGSKRGNPLGAGVALLGAAMLALSFRAERRMLLVVLGLALMASSPMACGGSGGPGGDSVTLQVVGVDAVDQQFRAVTINGLPALLGTTSIAGTGVVNPPATPTRTPTL